MTMFSFFKNQKRKVLTPIKELMYPDRGGYTGFSLFVWDTRGKPLDTVVLEREDFGSFRPSEIMKGGNGVRDYILEGRFYVFGVLLSMKLERGSLDRINTVFDDLRKHWTPLMDDLEKRRKALDEKKWKEKKTDAFGISTHIDELVDQAFKDSVVNTEYHERVEK